MSVSYDMCMSNMCWGGRNARGWHHFHNSKCRIVSVNDKASWRRCFSTVHEVLSKDLSFRDHEEK